MIFIHAYNKGSGSARALQAVFKERGENCLISWKRPRFTSAKVLVWGAKEIDYDLSKYRHLNTPEVTRPMCNKLTFFQKAASGVPDWTSSKEQADQWFAAGVTVVERHSLTGSGGDGIQIREPGSTGLQTAPLYVKYEKKTHEYRIHFGRNADGTFRVLHQQRKVARDPNGTTEWKIRNLASGFFFQQHGFEVPDAVLRAGSELLGSSFPAVDFVALDIIYHKPTDRAFVLEGNTAPGLEGTSVQRYADFIMERFG